MKVAYITNRFYPAKGGGERFIYQLLNELVHEKDFEATIYTSDFEFSGGKKRYSHISKRLWDSVRVIYLPSFRIFGKDALTIFPTLPFLARELSTFDIVHTFTYGYMTSWVPAVMKLLNLLKTKILFSPFYSPNYVYPELLTKFFNKTLGSLSVKTADAIVLITEKFKKVFADSRHIYVIPPPIEPIPVISEKEQASYVERLGLTQSTPIVLSLCRLTKSKGNHLLIQGFNAYIQATGDSRSHLIIAGDGPEEMALKKLITSLSLDSRVTIITGVNDHTREILFNICTVFALLSYSGEAFGITQIEAMSLGKPVLGSNKGAVPFVTHDRVNGAIVNPFNATEIANGLKSLLTHSQSYSEINIEKASKFTPKLISAKYLSVYKDLLSNR